MSRRVLLGKAGSEYGLFISKPGVNVINDSGTLANKDLLIFDSTQQGYAQLIAKGQATITRTGTNAGNTTVTFSSIAIPNPIVILYGAETGTSSSGLSYYLLSNTTTTAFTINVPATYPDYTSIYTGTGLGSNQSNKVTPLTTLVNYLVLRGET